METEPLPPKKGAEQPSTFWPMHCGQMAEWIEIPLGAEVGLVPGHIELDGDSAPKRGTTPLFSPCLLGMCRSQLKSESVGFGFCILNPSDSNSDLSHDHSQFSSTKLKTIAFCLNSKGITNGTMTYTVYLGHYTKHQIGQKVLVWFRVCSLWIRLNNYSLPICLFLRG